MSVPVIIAFSLGRFYEIEEFGHYSVATSFMSAMAVFLTFGLGNVISYEIAAIKGEDKAKISGLIVSGIKALLIFSFTGFCLIGILIYLLNYGSAIIHLILILACGYWFLGSSSVLNGVFMGLREMHYPALPTSGVVMAALSLVIPALYLHRPLWQIAAAWSLCQSVGCMISLWLLFKKGLIRKPSREKGQLLLLLRRSFGIGFNDAISRVGANLTNILLPIYLTSYHIGLFNGALKPFVVLRLAGECCLIFFSPYIAGVRHESRKKIEEYLALMHKLITFFSLTLITLPIFYSDFLIKVIFGEKLLDSAAYMAVLALGYFVFYLPPQSTPLMVLGLEWKVIWCSMMRVLVNLLGVIFLVPYFGIMGAVIAVNAAFAAYWITTLFWYRKIGFSPVKGIHRYTAFAMTVFFVGFVIRQWISEAFLGVILFFSLSLLLSLFIYWEESERSFAISYIKNRSPLRFRSREA
jgi:O-antigen/teichoic acid export membrane protein